MSARCPTCGQNLRAASKYSEILRVKPGEAVVLPGLTGKNRGAIYRFALDHGRHVSVREGLGCVVVRMNR